MRIFKEVISLVFLSAVSSVIANSFIDWLETFSPELASVTWLVLVIGAVIAVAYLVLKNRNK